MQIVALEELGNPLWSSVIDSERYYGKKRVRSKSGVGVPAAGYGSQLSLQ